MKLLRRWAFKILIRSCDSNVIKQRLCAIVDDIGFAADDMALCGLVYINLNEVIAELTASTNKGKDPFLTTNKGGI